MAIVQRERRGITGPVLVCESCRRRIDRASEGLVLWNPFEQNAAPVFAHVGACCRRES